MIWVDYAIIVLIGISAVIGLFRGFIREVFSLVAWIAAIFIGLTFSREFSGLLESVISYPSGRMAAAFIILFAVTMLLGTMVTHLLGEIVNKTGLSGSDRFAGFMFGIVRGALAVCVIVLLAGLTPLPEDSWWKESSLIAPFQSLALWLRNHIPEGLAGYVVYP